MIKTYQKIGSVAAEKFDGSDKMITKYGLDYEFDRCGEAHYYSSDIESVEVGDWIVTGISGERWEIADDVFNKMYTELPVISRKLSSYIELYKSKGYGLTAALCDCTDEDCPDDISDTEVARAWLDGYQIEEDLNNERFN